MLRCPPLASLPAAHRYERSLALHAVRADWRRLEDVGARHQNDAEIVLAAVAQEPMALRFASPELRNDRQVILTVARMRTGLFEALLSSISGQNGQRRGS